MLARLELEVRRDHPMTHEELTAVRAAVRGGRAAVPERLRAPAYALAAATLRSPDRGIAHPWLIYGLLVLALVNAGRAIRDPDAPWAIPMALLYLGLAAAAWAGRQVRARRAEAALAANSPDRPDPPDRGSGPANG